MSISKEDSIKYKSHIGTYDAKTNNENTMDKQKQLYCSRSVKAMYEFAKKNGINTTILDHTKILEKLFEFYDTKISDPTYVRIVKINLTSLNYDTNTNANSNDNNDEKKNEKSESESENEIEDENENESNNSSSSDSKYNSPSRIVTPDEFLFQMTKSKKKGIVDESSESNSYEEIQDLGYYGQEHDIMMSQYGNAECEYTAEEISNGYYLRSYLVDAMFAIDGCLLPDIISNFKNVYKIETINNHISNNCGTRVTASYRNISNILGVVYRLIEDGPKLNLWVQRESDLMLDSLIVGIGECVEDNGYIVCDEGMIQRIISPLQGRICGINLTMSFDVNQNVATFIDMINKVISDHIQNLSDDNIIKNVIKNFLCDKLHKPICKKYFKLIIDEWTEYSKIKFYGSNNKITDASNNLATIFNKYKGIINSCAVTNNSCTISFETFCELLNCLNCYPLEYNDQKLANLYCFNKTIIIFDIFLIALQKNLFNDLCVLENKIYQKYSQTTINNSAQQCNCNNCRNSSKNNIITAESINNILSSATKNILKKKISDASTIKYFNSIRDLGNMATEINKLISVMSDLKYITDKSEIINSDVNKIIPIIIEKIGTYIESINITITLSNKNKADIDAEKNNVSYLYQSRYCLKQTNDEIVSSYVIRQMNKYSTTNNISKFVKSMENIVNIIDNINVSVTKYEKIDDSVIDMILSDAIKNIDELCIADIIHLILLLLNINLNNQSNTVKKIKNNTDIYNSNGDSYIGLAVIDEIRGTDSDLDTINTHENESDTNINIDTNTNANDNNNDNDNVTDSMLNIMNDKAIDEIKDIWKKNILKELFNLFSNHIQNLVPLHTLFITYNKANIKISSQKISMTTILNNLLKIAEKIQEHGLKTIM
jgi:hypothetical protein